MSLAYHAQALSKDVDYRLGYVAGRANVAAVRAEIQGLKADPAVVSSHGLASLRSSAACGTIRHCSIASSAVSQLR